MRSGTSGASTRNWPRAAVWPWLVQLGQGRGGFYSYEGLENLVGCDIHNVPEIRPELQRLEEGAQVCGLVVGRHHAAQAQRGAFGRHGKRAWPGGIESLEAVVGQVSGSKRHGRLGEGRRPGGTKDGNVRSRPWTFPRILAERPGHPSRPSASSSACTC